jgi:serine/threonine protein phosphatase PrpC
MIISTSEEMNPLRRSTMEDVHVILPAGSWKACHDPNFSYLAIYDGHGGRDTVDFLKQTLATNVAIEINNNLEGDGDIDIPANLERALLITDIQAHKFGIPSSGSTVAICVIHHFKDKQQQQQKTILYTANVGDARIVVSSKRNKNNSKTTTDAAIRLTFDHSANDPQEVTRIDKNGGFCLQGRVVGVLAVARALGDFGIKKYVIAEPYTYSHETTCTTTCKLLSNKDNGDDNDNDNGEFVILACDGLWDIMSDQEAVDLVRAFKGDKQQVAAELTTYAIKNGSTDNVTVIVCWL